MYTMYNSAPQISSFPDRNHGIIKESPEAEQRA